MTTVTTTTNTVDNDDPRQETEQQHQHQRKRVPPKNEGRRSRRQKRVRKRPKVDSAVEPVYEFVVKRLELNGEQLDGYIRLIKPYAYTFKTYAKARWIGRSVLDVYSTEFGAYPKVWSGKRQRDTHVER